MNDMEVTTSDIALYENIHGTIKTARAGVIRTVNQTMVLTYWEVGKYISEAIGDRADYGKYLLNYLSERLTKDFGKGFDVSNLRKIRQFYLTFPIRDAMRLELSWTHYRTLMRISDEKKRNYYLTECAENSWNTRELERQINSFHYERLLATPNSSEGENITVTSQSDPSYILKDPYILEFLDLKENKSYNESELEQGLIDKLQDFLLELGKGFSFVARQKRITSEGGKHYYIDLVFYNYLLKCFVVIDLKASELTYQDVGQIDFYVRLFDDTVKQSDDNPTIGIVLCADKDESIAKYSVLADDNNLFASKYRMYMPTEDELAAEIARSREQLEEQFLLENTNYSEFADEEEFHGDFSESEL